MSKAMKLPAKFQQTTAFQKDLRAAVDRELESTGRSPRDVPSMYLKTAIILGWFAGSWLFLMFVAASPLGLIAGAISLGLAVAGIGFNIQHDGNHGAYSEHKAINWAMGFMMDVGGASSHLWRWKHNVFHHTHPNVAELDADIAQPLIRMSPLHQRRWFHRFQVVYAWPLYSLITLSWHFLGDFTELGAGEIKGRPFPRPRGLRLLELVAGKALFFTWAVVLPLMFHPVAQVAVAFGIASGVLGLTLSIVFQLAHVVDGAEFPEVPDSGKFDTDFSVHQLKTTVDFARGNPIATWYLGGLNYQVEHHLFPKVCHVHYPRLAPIVERVCSEHGVPYLAHRTFLGALRSHARWLLVMGRPERAPESMPTALESFRSAA